VLRGGGGRKRRLEKVEKQFVAAVTPRQNPEHKPAGARA